MRLPERERAKHEAQVHALLARALLLFSTEGQLVETAGVAPVGGGGEGGREGGREAAILQPPRWALGRAFCSHPF